jgi:hypothetical protein
MEEVFLSLSIIELLRRFPHELLKFSGEMRVGSFSREHTTFASNVCGGFFAWKTFEFTTLATAMKLFKNSSPELPKHDKQL